MSSLAGLKSWSRGAYDDTEKIEHSFQLKMKLRF